MNPNADKDPQVLTYIVGLVYLKMGDKSTVQDVQAEVDKLYQKFQDEVFDLAYNQLDQSKQEELKKIVDEGASQEQIQKFVLDNIPDFQKQLETYIAKFQEEYTGQSLEAPSDEIKEA